MKRSKTKYLSYIEETPKHYGELRTLARNATLKAVTNAKSRNLSVTYLKDGWVISEDAKGNQIRISEVEKSSRKTRSGVKFQLS